MMIFDKYNIRVCLGTFSARYFLGEADRDTSNILTKVQVQTQVQNQTTASLQVPPVHYCFNHFKRMYTLILPLYTILYIKEARLRVVPHVLQHLKKS